MLKSSYDVIVIGTDLPGLIMATLAAKRGYRVLVLGNGAKPNVYEVDEFSFVRTPNIMFGFQDSQPVRQVFQYLALSAEMRNLPRPLEPTCSVVMPGARAEITHMKGFLEDEVRREFPSAFQIFQELIHGLTENDPVLDELLAQYAVLPPAGLKDFLAYRRLRKQLAGFLSKDAYGLAPFEGHPQMMAFLAAPTQGMSRIFAPWRYPFPFLRLLAAGLLRGFYFVESGADSLKSLFFDKIRGNSGDVRLDDYLDTILVKRSRVRQIEVRAKDEAIGVGVLVVADRLAPVLDTIPEDQKKSRYHARLEKFSPSHYLTTVNLGANREIVPEGMGRTAFVVRDPQAPLEGANFLLVQVNPAMRPPDQEDPDKVAISISGLMPAGQLDENPSTLEAFGAELLDSARLLFPFMEQHKLVLSHSAVGVHPRTGRPVVDRAGLVPVWGETHPRSLDLLSVPIRTGYKNVLFMGEEVSGPLGFEGAFFVAQMGLKFLARLSSRKGVQA